MKSDIKMKSDEVLIKYFGFTMNEIKKRPKVLSYVRSMSEKDVEQKIELYRDTFDLTQEELNKMVKRSPQLLGYREDSVKYKAKFCIDELGLTQKELNKMVKSFPQLLGYREALVQEKKKFYMDEFGLSKEEFNKIVRKSPRLLSFKKNLVQAKETFFMKEFDLTKEEFGKMVKVFPKLLELKKGSVKEKHKQMSDIRLPKEYIINYPMIFGAPANKLKIRYTIVRSAGIDREQLIDRDISWAIQNERKTYARLCYILSVREKPDFNNLFTEEEKFKKRYKTDEVSSEDLMEEHPFTPGVLKKMEEILPKGEIVGLNKNEIKAIEKDKGGKE